jgi:hypothetical protein
MLMQCGRLLQMSESMEQGLHQLYETTIRNNCFPGTPPATNGQEPTTKQILEAMGQMKVSLWKRQSSTSVSASSHDRCSPAANTRICTEHQQQQQQQQQPPPSELMQHRSKKPKTSFATSSDAMQYFAGDSGSINGKSPSKPREAQSPSSFSTYSSQATTSSSGSRTVFEPETPVDMCTQFNIAVEEAKFKDRAPIIPTHSSNMVYGAMPDEAFFDFERYNQETLSSLVQAQQIQPDPMLQYLQTQTTYY